MARQESRKKRGKKGAAPTAKQAAQEKPVGPRVWLPSLLSALALWAAFPPLNLYVLAWLAPVGWLWVTMQPIPPTRRTYLVLWCSGCVFWLATLQGIRLASWPLYFGWIALSLYLAVYIPLFVFITRRLVQRIRLPVVLAAPAAWVALEFFRSYMATGYSANRLGHTQVDVPQVTQIADLFGSYGISFVVLTAASALVQMLVGWKSGTAVASISDKTPAPGLSGSSLSSRVAAIGYAAILLGSTIIYGVWRLRQADELAKVEPMLRVQLVQENTPSYFDSDQSSLEEAWTRYLETTRRLAIENGPAHLVVWPESTFSAGLPWLDPELPSVIPEKLVVTNQDDARRQLAELNSIFHQKVAMLLKAAKGQAAYASSTTNESAQSGNDLAETQPGDPMLFVGTEAGKITAEGLERYNAAMLIASDGKPLARYNKMHRVLFGEYIPLGILLKPLRDAFPITIEAGTAPEAFVVGETIIAPSICFESTMPRLMNRQIRMLGEDNRKPELLVNISNDSWFRGSTILDHHLACTRLCAIENRLPILVAANTGLTASIDGSGRILEMAPRLTSAGVLAKPTRDSRFSLPLWIGGYPLAWLCSIVSLLALKPTRK